MVKSNGVNAKLQHRQDHIEELNNIRMLLYKLQSVFNLPKKLRAAIDQKAYEVAVDAYSEAAPLLKKHGQKVGIREHHVATDAGRSGSQKLELSLYCVQPCPPSCTHLQSALKKVALEADACAKELAAYLKTQLMAAPDEAAECIAMIAKLGEPTETLQDAFLACKRQRMEAVLAAADLLLRNVDGTRTGAQPANGGLHMRLEWIKWLADVWNCNNHAFQCSHPYDGAPCGCAASCRWPW